MSGIGLSVRSDFGDWDRYLDALSQADTQGLLTQVGEQVLQATLLRFDSETAPDGSDWEQSLRAQREGGKTLTDRGHLRDSYLYRADHQEVEVGSNLIYAAIHHEGGTIKAKSGGQLKFKIGDHWVQTDSVEIPARPALGLSDEDEAEIDAVVREFYEELSRVH